MADADVWSEFDGYLEVGSCHELEVRPLPRRERRRRLKRIRRLGGIGFVHQTPVLHRRGEEGDGVNQ